MSIQQVVANTVTMKDLGNMFKTNGKQALQASGEILGVVAGVVHIAANVITTAANESDHNAAIDAKSLATLSKGLVVVDKVADAVQAAQIQAITDVDNDVAGLLALVGSISESSKVVIKAFESLKV
jgi:hypothetical protein